MTEANSTPNPVNDLSISPEAANLFGIAISLPMLAVLVGLYISFSPDHSLVVHLPGFLRMILFIGAIILGIFTHEIIHALGWSYFGNIPLRRIRINFLARTMTPYALALDPMPAKGYRLGTALPGLLLGAVPFILGTILGRPSIALFGMIFSMAASGDFLVLWIIRHVNAGDLVHDHPSRVGCVVISNRPNLL